jgi:hypothetical protein
VVAQQSVEASRVGLSVYGLEILIESAWQEVVEALRLDFAWFAADRPHDTPDVNVRISLRAPDFDRFAGATATFITPRNVVYQQPERTIVDYFGRVVAVRDRHTGVLEVEGEDLYIVHEAVYQFLISRLGEHFDQRGLPRIHGLGLAGSEGGVVVMLPSGGGKTTLALRALREENVKLLSEDSPLLDRHGFLHPFPLRIGVNATDAATLPAGHVRRIERMELHPKFALELHAFSDKIERGPRPLRHIVIGRRALGREASLERLPRRAAIATLFREAVVGVGIYQGMEWVLQHGMRDVFGQTDAFFTRARSCAAGLAHADVWRLTVGRDYDRNWAALQQLLG